jgi:hypothetical protein
VTVAASLALLGAALAAGAAPSPAGAPARAAPAAPRKVTLVYTADLAGWLEPCGCSADQRGGLARMATALRRIRAENPDTVFVAGGDLLFEGPLDPERRARDLARARTMAAALRAMGLAATVAGERDLEAGPAFLREVGLPVVRGKRLGAVGFGEPGSVPRAPFRAEVVHRGGTREAVGLADEARRQGIDLLLASHREDLLADDANRAVLDAAVPVVQVQGRGQSLARIDVTLAGDRSKGIQVLPGPAQRAEELDLLEVRGREYARRRAAAEAAGNAPLAAALGQKIGELAERQRALAAEPPPAPPADRPSLQVTFAPLGTDVPEDPEVRRILTRHYAEMARLNLADARARGRPCPDPARDEAGYAGAATAPPGGTRSCRDCHPAAFAQWQATPHAGAYATLERGERQFDLDCVGCHVTGWKRPGGPCDVATTEGKQGVQCEACHGPGNLHAIDPPGHIVRDPPVATCEGCHTPEHSTGFEPASYRKRVLGPGHGAGSAPTRP